jgi:hypothetical protein
MSENHSNSEEPAVVGIAWYRPEQWARLRALSTDPEALEDTFEEWVRLAEEKMEGLLQSGIMAKRISIDVEELNAWCIAQHLPMNGEARARFVAEKAAKL